MDLFTTPSLPAVDDSNVHGRQLVDAVGVAARRVLGHAGRFKGE
jgi:hypothetical protein